MPGCIQAAARTKGVEVIGLSVTIIIHHHPRAGGCLLRSGPLFPDEPEQTDHFLEVVRGLAEPHLTLQDAKQTLLLIEATRKGIARHAPVKLETTSPDTAWVPCVI